MRLDLCSKCDFFNQLTLPIWFIDIKTEQYIRTNPAWLKVTNGLDVIGLTTDQLTWFSEAEREEMKVKQRECVETGRAVTYERQVDQTWWKTTFVPTDMFIVGLAQDITLLREAEAEAETRNRDLETVLYAISHDLREPLLTIKGMVDLWQEEQDETYVEHIKQSVTQLNQQIQGLVDYSRAGQIMAEKSWVDVAALCQQAAKQINREITIETLPRICGNRAALYTVFYNLISNACKFGQAVTVTGETGPRHCSISVIDDGPGVPDHMKGEVFKLFTRASQNGLGLGLAIAQRIAARHQGHITFSNDPTTFTVKLRRVDLDCGE